MSDAKKVPPRGYVTKADRRWLEEGEEAAILPDAMEHFDTLEYLSLQEHTALLESESQSARAVLRNVEYQLRHYGFAAALNEIKKAKAAGEGEG